MDTSRNNLYLKYQGFLTVTDKPQPLSQEWGEDTEIAAVEIINPVYLIGTVTENEVDILTGNLSSQNKPVSPGGTDERGVRKLSDIYVKTRVAGESVRILFDVYGEGEE